ncbi:TonB-dependent receptor [Roseisolibacter sp. H3M3-2]|uniref:TonB-dependent receptor n=1 Tax=Roseisolibacter sp. H3M3-2 TaxID=3031323 RepID=UPI0023DB0971|nr:TonB-dependent receptor [Roseisolibacter sp. H3M3-2]MDF1505055.1 carboxypeptidase regulatory-like domain-containing protein [Roseisolibacter sp. H3M3-2]
MRPLVIAVALAAVAPAARAQTTITLEGVVRGENAAPVSGAQVVAVHQGTQETRRAVTGAAGTFRILGLPSGRYGVTVRAIGYKPAGDAVQLVIGQRAQLTFDLERGVNELTSVVVSATNPERAKQVEVQRLSVSAPILREEIENLPLNARGIMNLASVAPGIKAYAPQQGRTLPSAGAAPDLRFINLYLDGVEMKSMFNGNIVGLGQTGSPVPQEGLEEFRVFLNPYDAEYSRAGSYVISAVTRRGATKWEGSAFGFFQNSDAVGRTFIQRNAGTAPPNFGRQQAGVNVRGPLVKDKLFLAASYELTRTNNFIDVTPGRPATNPAIWDRYRGTFEAPNRNHAGVLRLTWTPGETHTVDGMWSTRYLTGEGNFGVATAREGGITQKYFVNVAQLRDKWQPTANFVNEASLQLVSWYHNEGPLVEGPVRVYPSVTVGTGGFPLVLRETHGRFVDRATYTLDAAGTHLLKAGVEASRVGASQFLPTNRFGSFSFPTDTSTLPNSASLGVGFFDPTSTADAKASLSGTIVGAYLNDEWRPVPNLAINVGVRYDVELNTLNNDFTVPWAQDGQLVSALEGAGYGRWINRGNRKNDLNNISPRISFSWDPTKQNRTFLRGGFGVVYDRATSMIGFGERLNAAWRTYSFVNPGTTDPEVLRQRVVSGGVQATPALVLVKDKIETPKNTQWSVGIGQQFTSQFGVNLDYIDQRMSDLYVRLNPNYFNTTTRARALTPRYGDITLWDDFGKARFRGLISQATYQRQRTRVNLAYTLGFYEADFDGNIAQIFPFRSSYDMQATSGDERHRAVLSTVTPIPFGFTFSAIGTVASPRPVAVTDGRDLNANNVFFDDFPNGDRTVRPANEWKNWYRTVDLRLSRPIFTSGSRKVSASVEVFNVFNSDNIATFNARQLDAAGRPITNYLQPNSAFAARQAQVGLRADF